MKQKVRKVLAVGGMAIVIGASSFGYEANAKTPANNRVISTGQNITKTEKKEKKGVRQALRYEQKISQHKRTIPGVVSVISENSITMTRGDKTFTINVTDATRILNLKWNKIILADIKVGDKIRVFGNITETTISAATIRDISIK